MAVFLAAYLGSIPMAAIGQTLKPVLTQHLSPSKGTA